MKAAQSIILALLVLAILSGRTFAADFQILPISAVQVNNIGQPDDKRQWMVKAILLDGESGQGYHCSLTILGGNGEIAKGNPIVCWDIGRLPKGNSPLRAEAATQMGVSFSDDKVKVVPWSPSPVWFVEKENIGTLRLCSFVETTTCSVGVSIRKR